MDKVFSCNTESLCIVCASTSSLHTFDVIWILVQGHGGILVGVLILFKFDVALGSIAVNDRDQLMVRFVNMNEAPSVTIYCLFVLQRKEKGIALKLKVVSLTRLLDGTSFNYHLDVGLSATSTLQHLSLRLWWC